MIKDNKRYCDRCGVELTKRNNVCGFELCDKCNEVLGQQLAIKNDLPHCQHTDEEIAKSFIEDVEAVKDQLPCFCEQMDFPNTFDEFANLYGFKDKDEVYTNGSELIPVFRVKQWLEHISTTKNDLGVDCIDRKAIEKHIEDGLNSGKYGHDAVNIMTEIHFMPSVTPQLSGSEVTAIAERTTKLTKECEEAYNKGYEDGVKSVNICPHCGEYIGAEE